METLILTLVVFLVAVLAMTASAMRGVTSTTSIRFLTLDGTLADLSAPIDKDAAIEIVTRDDPRSLELIRHDAAHVMAEAVVDLFPEAKLGIGPAIKDGFYYDFDLPRALTPQDLKAIEKTIANKTVTYDLERQMEGAKLLKCSEFAQAIVDNM